jgi:hypothetical protein
MTTVIRDVTAARQLKHAARDVEADRARRRATDVLVVCADHAGPAVNLARRLVRAAAGAGLRARDLIADRPAMRHMDGWRAVIRETDAFLVIAVNTGRDALADGVSAATPVVTWLTEEASLSADVASVLGDGDWLAAPFASIREAAIEAGVRPERALLAPPGADPEAVVRATLPAPAFDAEDVGLHHATYAAVWDEAARWARSQVETRGWAQPAADLLAAAEQSRQLSFNEDENRRAMIDLIDRVLIPGVTQEAYLKVWRDAGLAMEATRGPILCISMDGRVSTRLMDAAASGRPVLVCACASGDGSDHWRSYLPSARLATPIETPRALRKALKSIGRLADPVARDSTSRQALLDRHGMVQRVRSVCAAVRGG